MLFNSMDFMFFFPITVLGYYIIPKKIRYVWLLICSYYFYMSWNPYYILLLLLSTVITYLGGLVLGTEKVSRWACKKRKFILAIVIIINLGILGYFKYSNFLLESIAGLLQKIGITILVPKVDVVLPVGISFYTFQALGYSIDIYRKKIKPEKNIIRYALFVSFFPQLVAGPIERSENLLPQLQKIEKQKYDIKDIYCGMIYILWGLFLKMVIADRIAAIVDVIFDSYYIYGGIELIIGAAAFAIQIYCDFAGYSTIAIGAAKVFGITLMENFDAPYFAGSIKEFWKRWHISLSEWFRDYFYISLGGNRCSKIRKYFNVMLTFLVSGLWHGASWNYVIWGGIHGLFQITGDILTPLKAKISKRYQIHTNCFSYKLGRVIGTFVLTDLAWIFFRCRSVHAALSYIKRIFIDFDPWVLSQEDALLFGLDRIEVNILLMSLSLLFLAEILKYKKRKAMAVFILEQNAVFQYISIVGMFLLILIFGIYGPEFNPQAFIYFQF